MADKKGDIGSRAIGGLAAAGAGFATRKVMSLTWKRITGKEPPQHPEDPQVSLAEALGWATAMAVAISTARLLATRAATKRFSAPGCAQTKD